MAADLIVQVKAQLDEYRGEIDAAAQETEAFAERGSGAMAYLNENIGAITAATAAMGAALEGFARTQAGTNESLERASIITGESAESLREMADGLTDSTNSSADMVGGMDELIRRGLRTREEFEQVLPVMDNFAGATGQTMPEAIDNVNRVLQALGEPLTNAGEHIDQMTRFVRETDVPMGTLRRNLSRVPDELQAMGFGLEDVAAGIEVMRERGFSGEEAVREFRRTVEEGEGDLNKFFEALGVTSEEFAGYQEAVGQADGITQQFADTNAAQLTVLEQAQQWVANLFTEYGSLASTAAQLAPALLAVGPAIKGAQVAMSLALGPVGLIAAAIAGLATAAYLVWENWDEVKELLSGVWETIKSRAVAVFDAIVGSITTFRDNVIQYFGELRDDVVQVVEDMVDAVVEKFTGMFTGAVDSVKSMASDATGWIKDMASEWVGNSIIPDMVTDVLDEFEMMHTGTVDTTRAMTTDLTAEVRTLAGNLGDLGEQLGIDWLGKIGGMVDGTIGEFQRMWRTVSEIWGGLNSLFGGDGSIVSGLSSLFGGDAGSGGLTGSLGGLVSAGKSIVSGLGGLFGGGTAGGISGSTVVGTSPLATGSAAASSGFGLAATQAGVVAAPLVLGPIIDDLISTSLKSQVAEARRAMQGVGQSELGPLGLQIGANDGFGFGSGPNIGFARNIAREQMGRTAFDIGDGITTFKGMGLDELRGTLSDIERQFEDLKSTASQVFTGSGASAAQMGQILQDGVVDRIELAEIGLQNIGDAITNTKSGVTTLGDVSAEQFQRLVDAVRSGEVRLDALRGDVRLNQREMLALGEMGITAGQLISQGIDRAALNAQGSLAYLRREGVATFGAIEGAANAAASIGSGSARSFGGAPGGGGGNDAAEEVRRLRQDVRRDGRRRSFGGQF